MTQTTDPFLQKAWKHLDELRAVRSALIQQVEAAHEELRRIDQEGQKLAATIEAYIEFMQIGEREAEQASREDKKARTAHLDLPRGAYASLVYEALVELGGTATLGQIVNHLRQTLRIPQAEHSYFSTRSALNRHDGIAKGGGVYRLKQLQESASDQEVLAS